MPDGAFFVIMVTKIVVVFGLMLLSVTYLTWLERKVIGDIQVRLGPMRVGPHGLLQPIADGIKLLFKEDIVPQAADRVLYLLAPVVALIPAFISFAVIRSEIISDSSDRPSTWSSPTSISGCCMCSVWPRSASMGSSWAGGPRTTSTRCLGGCVPQPR